MSDKIQHPKEFLPEPHNNWFIRTIDSALQWMAESMLPSRFLFLITLTIPIVCLLPGFTWMEKFVIILSSNWLQAWALPALQWFSNKVQARLDAKADADHLALTHIGDEVENIRDRQEYLIRLVERRRKKW